MNDERKPAFNVKLLKGRKGIVSLLKEISSLDIFDSPGSSNFHEDGLFSTEIFGRVGSEDRDRRFGYIDLKTSILHPLVWDLIQKVKALYHGILMGKEFATWDPKTKDFIKANDITGETGYAFFMSHWEELELVMGTSPIRKARIELLNKYRNEAINDYILVMPAGLRDVEMSGGRVKEGEINDHYRKLISISNTVASTTYRDTSVFNKARISQQLAFNEVYKTIENLISGKKGFLAAKWGSRNIVNGTRNVISAMDPSISDLDDTHSPTANDTIAGLWQVSRGALPVFIKALKDGILSPIFSSGEGSAKLIDIKTLKSEYTDVSPNTFDKWTTLEGLEKVISGLSKIPQRSKPVLIEGRYLALVYRPKNKKVFKVFYDIDELPDGLSKEDVYPITYFELIYLAYYKDVNKLKGLPTRYPIEGEGSIYPSQIYLKTTVISEVRTELDNDWTPYEDSRYTATVYPVLNNPSYIDTTVIHSSRLALNGGDYDGDQMSLNILYTSEGILEIEFILTTREAYVNPAGGFRASMETLTTTLVMQNITFD